MAIIIQPDGTEEPLVELSLESIQHAVGGWIERVPLVDEEGCLYINEEGKIHGMPYNAQATMIADLFGDDYIVGPAVLLTDEEEASLG